MPFGNKNLLLTLCQFTWNKRICMEFYPKKAMEHTNNVPAMKYEEKNKRALDVLLLLGKPSSIHICYFFSVEPR
jgi:hypothetical protein